MTPRSCITIVRLTPYWERIEKIVILPPSLTYGDAIAKAVSESTGNKLQDVQRAFKNLQENTPIPGADGAWEDKNHKEATLGTLFAEGRLRFLDDPYGVSVGMNGTLFY